MGLNKKYSGYKSFDYLEKDIDYKVFELDRPLDWIRDKGWEPYVVPLSASEEERANRLAAGNIIISLHDHLHIQPKDINDMREFSKQDFLDTAYEALSKSCLDCVFDNMPSARNTSTSKSGWKFTDLLHSLGIKRCDVAHQDFAIIAERVDDILRAHNEGKVALVLASESAMPIENELDRLDILYGFGLRALGLIYNESNALGTGLKEERDSGLTYFGRQCVERMNKLGIVIDTAHCSDQTTLDAVKVSKKPILASHVGSRVVYNIKRLKPDNVLKAIADKGGLTGIEAAPHTTLSEKQPEHNIESFMEHFEYIKDLVGIDYVTFGTDTHYGDHVAFHNAYRSTVYLKGVFAEPEHDVPYVKGLENPTENYWNILRWLVKHGYSDEDIAKVMGGNTIRVLKEIWS